MDEDIEAAAIQIARILGVADFSHVVEDIENWLLDRFLDQPINENPYNLAKEYASHLASSPTS